MALHCPATLLVAPAPREEDDRRRLLAALADERVLAVVTAPDDATGRLVADELDAPLEADPGLASPSVDDAVLGAVADLHRGETVLVLTRSGGGGDAPFVRVEIG